jgi:hypothetical protein
MDKRTRITTALVVVVAFLISASFHLLWAQYTTSGPLVIDLLDDGPAIVFRLAGQDVASINLDRTAAQGRPRLQIQASNTPVMTIGGEKNDTTLQITRSPVDEPRFEVDIQGQIEDGERRGIDVRIGGSLTVGMEEALCPYPYHESGCVPIDPNGAINIARRRDPENLDMANIRIFRYNNLTHEIEEVWRQGSTSDGWPYLNPVVEETGLNDDAPRFWFRSGAHWVKLYMCDSSGSVCGVLSRDNDGGLKYISPSGTVTVLATD